MQELKAMHIWICWKYEIKNGKRTKVPKSAAGGATGTTERWRKTWVTYDDAILAKERINADGVGFILPKGYFFLDIDGRSVNDAFAKRLLKRFDTYSEYSVSDNGIHIYGKCDLSKIPTYTDKVNCVNKRIPPNLSSFLMMVITVITAHIPRLMQRCVQ